MNISKYNLPPLSNNLVFILSGIRSGSTLLRCILNSHSDIYAPHELHFSYLKVKADDEYVKLALDSLGISDKRLKMFLWDCMYRSLLKQSRKKILIDKSPSNLMVYNDLFNNWPSAKYIFLKRNPIAIVQSIVNANDGRSYDDAAKHVLKVVATMNQARNRIGENSITISYEELVVEPNYTLTSICDFLSVNFESESLMYGKKNHGAYIYGLGDWSQNIHKGYIVSDRMSIDEKSVQAGMRSELWSELLKACNSWGYDKGRIS